MQLFGLPLIEMEMEREETLGFFPKAPTAGLLYTHTHASTNIRIWAQTRTPETDGRALREEMKKLTLDAR